MLMAVAEMTKLEGVTSFDKWPGYEQQCGSKGLKQGRNMGLKKRKKEIALQKMPTNIWHKSHQRHSQKRILRSGIASGNLQRRKGWEM